MTVGEPGDEIVGDARAQGLSTHSHRQNSANGEGLFDPTYLAEPFDHKTAQVRRLHLATHPSHPNPRGAWTTGGYARTHMPGIRLRTEHVSGYTG